ncbi:MAG: helix-turn-helix transcriptional regulator [Cyanobacteria bacterium P01_G01_bin.38]
MINFPMTHPTSITSADSPMQTSRLQKKIGITVFPSPGNTISHESTLNWDLLHLLDITTSGFSVPEVCTDTDTPQTALSELRKLSGLTWEQLAKLFNVSRRSLHFWASGQPISRFNEESLHRLLSTLRYINRGSANTNRHILLSPCKNDQIPFDLLVAGRYEDVKNLLGYGNIPEQVQLKPIDDNELVSRKPQKPGELIDALHEPVHKDISRSRSVRSAKVRKRDRKQ